MDQRDQSDERNEDANERLRSWRPADEAGCDHNVRIMLGQRGEVCHLCSALGFGSRP